MGTRSTRLRRREGDVVEVPLGDSTIAFGRVLVGRTVVEFYDLRVAQGQELDPESIACSPVLFRIMVADSPFRGRWKHIGQVPLTQDERLAVFEFFKQ